jgi:hypothetical protein
VPTEHPTEYPTAHPTAVRSLNHTKQHQLLPSIRDAVAVLAWNHTEYSLFVPPAMA